MQKERRERIARDRTWKFIGLLGAARAYVKTLREDQGPGDYCHDSRAADLVAAAIVYARSIKSK